MYTLVAYVRVKNQVIGIKRNVDIQPPGATRR